MIHVELSRKENQSVLNRKLAHASTYV